MLLLSVSVCRYAVRFRLSVYASIIWPTAEHTCSIKWISYRWCFLPDRTSPSESTFVWLRYSCGSGNCIFDHILHQSPVFIGHGLCCRTFWSRSWRMRWAIPPVTSQHRQACKTLERANATGPDRQKPENQKGPAVVAVAGPWPLHSERLWGSGNTNCLAHPGQFQCFFLSNTVKSQVLQILHMLKTCTSLTRLGYQISWRFVQGTGTLGCTRWLGICLGSASFFA